MCSEVIFGSEFELWNKDFHYGIDAEAGSAILFDRLQNVRKLGRQSNISDCLRMRKNLTENLF